MPGKRHAQAVLISTLLLGLAIPRAQAASRQAPAAAELSTRVETNLAQHLDAPRIAAWLDTLAPNSLEHEAATWILAWLPLSDLADLTLPLFREHVELAAESYRESPWRDELPHELWLHFVVPHRVSQEPAQAWRQRFRDELWPRVKDAANMEVAALAVNRWCREQATFKPTSGRDQGPLTTAARGIGRCEEEMILAICALRAAGIPARSCATPYWSFTDNNHAWVEAWADGRWWYLGGCEPDRCLNRAWFTGSASRTGFVRSVGYGEFDPAPEALYRAEDGATVINSTAVYTDPIFVTATLGGAYSDLPEPDIRVNVLNFGSLRPVARIRSGDSIALGPGEYAFTAGTEDDLLLEVGGGRSGDRIGVTLDEADRYDLQGSPGFWLRYPESDARPARDLDLVSEAEDARLKRAIARQDGDRAKLRVPDETERELLAALPDAQRERLEAAFELPFERVSTLFLLLEAYPDSAGREDLLGFLDACDDKDLLELEGPGVRSHIDGARARRHRLEVFGISIPDSIHRQALLPCRIEREPGGPWRDALPLLPLAAGARASLQSFLKTWAERTTKVENSFFGSPLNPAQSWALGQGTERDLKIGLVGLLRANGFPARYRHGKVEAWLDGWLPLDAEAGSIIETGSEGDGGTGRLEIVITRGGEPFEAAESYRHFNLSRPKAGWLESPWWDPILGEQDWDAGRFVLSSANRVPGGSIYGRLRAFEVEPGEITRVELPLDIGPGWEPGETFFSGPAPARLRETLTANAIDTPRRDCLTFVFPDGEPAQRMIAALGRVRPRLEADGIALHFVRIGARRVKISAGVRGAMSEAGFPPEAIIGCMSEDSATDLLAGEELLPIVELKLGGSSRYCRAGFDTAVDASLHLVMDLFAAGSP